LYHRTSVDAVLAQAGCAALRSYYALDDSEQRELVVVGDDANGDDMAAGAVDDIMVSWPPYCGSANPPGP
jgi:hypothetical protein